MKLGRLPHSPEQLAALPSLAAHRMAAFVPEPVLDRHAVAYHPRLFQNDILPDCTAAGLANHILAVEAVNGVQPVLDPSRVPPFYAGCAGCDPTDAAMAATDGAVMADVLARQAAGGFDIGQQVPLVARYGVLPLSRTALANAMCRLSGAYVGVTLRDRDMQTVGQRWTAGDDGPVIGGHCVVLWDYSGLADDDTVRIATWGALQPASWVWVMARVEEAYGLVWPQLTMPEGHDAGVDLAALAGGRERQDNESTASQP